MKILHLIYTTGIAGAEKYLVNLLPGLKQYNIECDLICVCPKLSVPILTPYCNTMNSNGVKTTLITGRKYFFLSIAKTINKYLRKEGITVLHSHLLNADLIASLIKTIYNKNIFIISSKHGYDERYLIKYEAEADPHKINRNLYYYLTKFLLKKIDANLAISKAISDLYFNIKLTSKHYHYIHHSIPKLSSIENPVAKKSKQLIITGRLEKMKGHKFLLNALPKVIQSFPDVKLLILGEGSEKKTLQAQAKQLGITKYVDFMGFRSNPYPFIQESEIIILPSLFEPFGLVFIEAFALKVPIIAFDVPAANELITDNETGILVPKLNSEMLAQKIIFHLQNPEKRKYVSEKAYQKFLNHYTLDRMIAETASWYKSLFSHTL